MEPITIVDEYLEFHQKYEQLCGKILVIMQIGSFYEAYQIDDKGSNLTVISNLLNLVLFKKDKSLQIINRQNPYMIGFPINFNTKYTNILINNGYTVIEVSQKLTVSATNERHYTREVTNIYHPINKI